MSKIGRNDICPCGSGKKYKRCHIGKPLVDPRSPEFLQRAADLLERRVRAERRRRQTFGNVRPIIHADAWGKKLVAVGGRIYFNDDSKITFAEFIQGHLTSSLGTQWWRAEATKPVIARHPIAQWQTHAETLMRAEKPDERGRYSIPQDGVVSAFMALAYDLYVVRNNIAFHDRIIDRLRLRDSFTGIRYELLVAATFVRAGFKVAPENESSSTTHPEFLATHAESNFEVAVEAKARNRRQSDTNPTRAGVDDLIAKAARQGIANKPFALFVDVAMPPASRLPPAWCEEVDQSVKVLAEKHGSSPFDWVFFTNIPHGEFVEWIPRGSRIPHDIHQAIHSAFGQHCRIPEFETGS